MNKEKINLEFNCFKRKNRLSINLCFDNGSKRTLLATFCTDLAIFEL